MNIQSVKNRSKNPSFLTADSAISNFLLKNPAVIQLLPPCARNTHPR
jgi:hypothetical protein